MNLPENEVNPYAAPLTTAIPPTKPSTDIEAIRRQYLSHEASIRSFGMLYMIGGVLSILVGIIVVFTGFTPVPNRGPNDFPTVILIPLGLVYLGLGGLQLWVAMGLRKLSSAGQIGATVLAAIGLLAIPIGTLISGYLLYLLWSKKGMFVFTPEYRDIRAKTPHIKYKTSIIVWVFVALLLLLMVAAVVSTFLG